MIKSVNKYKQLGELKSIKQTITKAPYFQNSQKVFERERLRIKSD